MTHYPIVRDAVLAHLRALDNGTIYTEANSARNDWSVRNADTPDSAVVSMWQRSQFGNSLLGRAEMGKRQELHYPRISLLYAIGQGEGGDGAAVNAVEDRAVEVIGWFNQYLRLNGAEGVTRAEVTAMGVVELIGSRKSENVTHARIDIDLTVACKISMNPIEPGY